MGRSKKVKNKLPKGIQTKCNAIIHTASVAAGGVGTGLAQIPLADNAVITPIQITMIISLGKVFDQKITESAAKAIISGAGASLIGRGISQALVGWIPGVGNAINTATAAGLTEAIGWMAVDNFWNNCRYQEDGMDKEQQEEKPDQENELNQTESKIAELEKKAAEFIKGAKSIKENKDEFCELQDEIRKEMEWSSLPEELLTRLKKIDDDLYELYMS